MLFWSFILAFVLGILYYMTPTYNVVDVEQKPQADTMVAAFVNAHQAAKRMMYTDKGSVTNQCDSTDDSGNPIKIDCLDDEGNPIEVKDTSKRTITFTYKTAMKDLKTAIQTTTTNATVGILSAPYVSTETPSITDGNNVYGGGTLATINADNIRQILAVVPENDDGTDKFSEITSMVACISDKKWAFDKDDSGTIQTDEMGNPKYVQQSSDTTYLTFDCNGGKSKGGGDYVITYMQAPDSQKSTLARNELWRSGILRRTKGSHECGVLSLISKNKDNRTRQKYDENAEYVLDNSRRFTVSVPKAITDVLKQDEALENDMNAGYLLFCITPIDDIRASFEWKCNHGYGKYKIMDGTTMVQDCTGSETE